MSTANAKRALSTTTKQVSPADAIQQALVTLTDIAVHGNYDQQLTASSIIVSLYGGPDA